MREIAARFCGIRHVVRTGVLLQTLALLSLCSGLAIAQLQGQDGIPVMPDYSSHRASSFARDGSNRDYIQLAPAKLARSSMRTDRLRSGASGSPFRTRGGIT